MAAFADWLGRRESSDDIIAPGPVARLAATLGRDDPTPKPGDPLPPLWHWLYFLDAPSRATLNTDGHAMRGGFLPPNPAPNKTAKR